MNFKSGYLIAWIVIAACLASASEAASPLIRGRFSYDGIANCQQPPIKDFRFHAEGTAVLSTDRTASLDVNSSASGRTNLNAVLGKRTEAPGGSTTLNVVGRHTLRAVRDYPNNITIVMMTIRGNDCKMTIEDRLKPGKRVYTFYRGSDSVAYCAHPQITRTHCEAY
ncbi:hypothetical protein SAMN05444159_5059 [Bradyrhizobium lablabi]|uniref:Uncharacterized protein n=1 Tax=Bradyrhizobium lablabi TaxID=722472 RepID=A0A1M6Y359_9BRAD|nr:hypothetical protein [Bradyrhizobium lablabi]SHL12559.1 hypothetical protein SAMN05444159_5059 [Bradyrhizobium lablabi]